MEVHQDATPAKCFTAAHTSTTHLGPLPHRSQLPNTLHHGNGNDGAALSAPPCNSSVALRQRHVCAPAESNPGGTCPSCPLASTSNNCVETLSLDGSRSSNCSMSSTNSSKPSKGCSATNDSSRISWHSMNPKCIGRLRPPPRRQKPQRRPTAWTPKK